MAYTIDEQETHIWYDPKTKETVVETNYVHDINHYLRIIADGGMELLEHEVEGDRVISLRAKVLDGPYSLSRKLKKNGLYLMKCVNAYVNNLRKLASPNRLCIRTGDF
jgi:hypothetical protein